MKKNIEQEILKECRHQFIYGSNKDIIELLNSENLSFCYINSLNLPDLDKNNNVDKIMMKAISREYLNFIVVYELVNKLNNYSLTDNQLNILLSSFGCIDNINSLKQLLVLLEQSKDFYKNNYISLCAGNQINCDINSLSIPFVDLVMFVKDYKKIINYNSYICIFFNETLTSRLLKQAINSLIYSRINTDVSVKVICDSNKWDVYYDLDGNMLENMHDYGIVQLDNGYQKVKKNNNL